jgi:hypothetical protein
LVIACAPRTFSRMNWLLEEVGLLEGYLSARQSGEVQAGVRSGKLMGHAQLATRR